MTIFAGLDVSDKVLVDGPPISCDVDRALHHQLPGKPSVILVEVRQSSHFSWYSAAKISTAVDIRKR